MFCCNFKTSYISCAIIDTSWIITAPLSIQAKNQFFMWQFQCSKSNFTLITAVKNVVSTVVEEREKFAVKYYNFTATRFWLWLFYYRLCVVKWNCFFFTSQNISVQTIVEFHSMACKTQLIFISNWTPSNQRIFEDNLRVVKAWHIFDKLFM